MLGFLRTFVRRLSQPRGAGLLEIGAQAPAFEVEDHLGRRQRLADYRGRRVVLWFYPKADTPG
jgi:peroxiredoxin